MITRTNRQILCAGLLALMLGLPAMSAAAPGAPPAKGSPLSVNWNAVFYSAGQVPGYSYIWFGWIKLIVTPDCSNGICGIGGPGSYPFYRIP